LISILNESFLRIQKLLSTLCSELKIRTFNNSINRASLLTQTTVNTLDHIDIVPRGPSSTIVTSRTRLNSYGLGRTDGFTQLASDTAFFTIWIAPQGMLTPKTRRQTILLKWIIQSRLRLQHVAHADKEGGNELQQKD